jgi:putative transposase
MYCFFIRLESRKVEVSGLTPPPNERWMKQIARNVTMDDWGFLDNCRYLINDRGTRYCQSFRDIIEFGDVKTLPLPACSPNLNAFAECRVKSVKHDCLSKLILFGEASLRRALREYLVPYHPERNHQGKNNILLFPATRQAVYRVAGSVSCKERLGGLLKYYYREAA